MPADKNTRHTADNALMTALAAGQTVESAAHTANISVRTAYRRLADPVFAARLDELREQIVRQAATLLTNASVGAVQTLNALRSKKTPPTVRLGAARAILELGPAFRREEELRRRLKAVEQKLGMRPADGAEGSPDDDDASSPGEPAGEGRGICSGEDAG